MTKKLKEEQLEELQGKLNSYYEVPLDYKKLEVELPTFLQRMMNSGVLSEQLQRIAEVDSEDIPDIAKEMNEKDCKFFMKYNKAKGSFDLIIRKKKVGKAGYQDVIQKNIVDELLVGQESDAEDDEEAAEVDVKDDEGTKDAIYDYFQKVKSYGTKSHKLNKLHGLTKPQFNAAMKALEAPPYDLKLDFVRGVKGSGANVSGLKVSNKKTGAKIGDKKIKEALTNTCCQYCQVI